MAHRAMQAFPLEAGERLCITREFVGKELQGDVAIQLQVFRLIHYAHAPTADFAEDAVMGNRLPHGLGVGSHWREILCRYRGRVNSGVRKKLLKFGVLGLGLLQDGDVGVGVLPKTEKVLIGFPLLGRVAATSEGASPSQMRQRAQRGI